MKIFDTDFIRMLSLLILMAIVCNIADHVFNASNSAISMSAIVTAIVVGFPLFSRRLKK